MPSASGSPLSQKTVTFLRRQITTGEWPVNSRIPIESELQEMIGVGKTTVREAVRSLANLGMLETLVGRGTFVRSRTPVSGVITDFLSDFDVTQILGYRRALEIEAAQLAAVNRTPEQLATLRAAYEYDRDAGTDRPRTAERGTTPGSFHQVLFEASGNTLMMSLYSGVMAALHRALRRGTVVHGAPHEQRLADHAAILSAIEERSVTAAAHSMALHVDRDLLPLGQGAVDGTGAVTPRMSAIGSISGADY